MYNARNAFNFEANLVLKQHNEEQITENGNTVYVHIRVRVQNEEMMYFCK
jgi:hypothetical protein